MKQSLNFQFDLHTIIVLCGPTQCGKTTFTEKLYQALIPLGDVAVLSSDMIRRQLLGSGASEDDLQPHSPQMHAVSRQAFDILFARLKAQTTYPVNTPFVIIDTRGMDQRFRKQILDIAHTSHYKTALLTFEYKNRSEYWQYSDEATKRGIEFDLSKFLRKTLQEIASDYDKMSKKAQWGQRLRVKERDSDLNVSLREYPGDSKGVTRVCYDRGHAVAIVGDVHESVEAFNELLDNIRTKYGQDTLIVQLGDYLDKGRATLRMVQAAYNEYKKGTLFVVGNHEAYVYRATKGEVDRNEELEKSYFTAVPALLADTPEAKDALAKFYEIYENSSPFLKLVSPGAKDIVVTHAPCEVKHLTKLDADSQRAQRNLYIKDRTLPLRDVLAFVQEESESSHPIHIFGHTTHASPTLMYKNRVYLDTGAVYGNKLSAFVMRDGRYEFEQVSAPNLSGETRELPKDLTVSLDKFKPFDIRDYDLTPQESRLVRHVKHNGVKFISGTMPPSPSTETSLESLEAGLEYFRKRGVGQVVLQPKYMGNRCQLYLFRDPEKEDFGVSRGGWRIRRVTTSAKIGDNPVAQVESNDPFVELLAQWSSKVFSDNPDLQSIILDGELLPWQSLGADLIEHTFEAYSHLVGYEVSILSEDYAFRNLDLGQTFDPMGRMTHLAAYDEALASYTGDQELEFKPFSILEVNGQAYAGSNYTAFRTYNTDDTRIVRLDTPNYEEEVGWANEFYSTLTVEQRMEGVVIKPLDPTISLYDGKDKPDVVPYMKVRNPEYLRLIYGYDYPMRADKLIRQKNISGKAAVGLREHRLTHKMLTATDEQRQEYVVKMIGEMKREADLDPRL